MTGEKLLHIFLQTAAGQAMHWSRFKINDPRQIYNIISQRVFPAIKYLRYHEMPIERAVS